MCLLYLNCLSDALVNGGSSYACGIQLEGTSQLTQDPKLEFDISPNPTKAEIMFKGLGELSQVNCKIMNATGQIVLDQPIQTNTVSVAHLSAGIYFIVLETENSEVFRGKLVVL